MKARTDWTELRDSKPDTEHCNTECKTVQSVTSYHNYNHAVLSVPKW